jgi:hypothetical protein
MAMAEGSSNVVMRAGWLVLRLRSAQRRANLRSGWQSIGSTKVKEQYGTEQ